MSKQYDLEENIPALPKSLNFEFPIHKDLIFKKHLNFVNYFTTLTIPLTGKANFLSSHPIVIGVQNVAIHHETTREEPVEQLIPSLKE